MAAIVYNVKRGDAIPVIGLEVLNSDGDPYDLSGTTAIFYMYTDDENRTAKINGVEAVVDPPGTSGLLTYQFSGTDTDTSGRYLGEFEVAFEGGVVGTFPSGNDFIYINIASDLRE